MLYLGFMTLATWSIILYIGRMWYFGLCTSDMLTIDIWVRIPSEEKGTLEFKLRPFLWSVEEEGLKKLGLGLLGALDEVLDMLPLKLTRTCSDCLSAISSRVAVDYVVIAPARIGSRWSIFDRSACHHCCSIFLRSYGSYCRLGVWACLRVWSERRGFMR